eukprot:3400676-Heterocapsa_arctica.AAC.1
MVLVVLLPFLDEPPALLLRYAFLVGFRADPLHVAPLLVDLLADGRRFRNARARQTSLRLLPGDRPAALRAACPLALRGRLGQRVLPPVSSLPPAVPGPWRPPHLWPGGGPSRPDPGLPAPWLPRRAPTLTARGCAPPAHASRLSRPGTPALSCTRAP